MRVLLLGELSGLHEELRPGLDSLGVEVTTAHSREAHPTYRSDVPLFQVRRGDTGLLTELRDIGSTLLHARDLTGFDVVQVLTPKVFNWRINLPLLKFLKRRNGAMVLVTTACSSDYHRRVRELDYSPCADCKAFDLENDACIYDSAAERSAEHAAYELADAIVVTHFEYWHALADTPFASKLVKIPLPVDTSRHAAAPWVPQPKLRVWYGETRYGFKGGRSIHAALAKVLAEHGDRVEVIKTPRLAFSEYLRFLDSVHVVIDQANSYGPGMNALYALARGRITMTGYERETLDFLGATSTPAINIPPDAEGIASALSGLLAGPQRWPELSRASRDFAREHHDTRVIARRYVDLYEELFSRPS